jgi:hypothetical protein
MSIAVTKSTAVAIEKEVTEGTYVTPASAAAYVQTLADGLEIKPTKELLERNVFTASIGKITPRTGQRSVSGSVPTECRANSVEGAAPEFSHLMESAFGTKRQRTTTVTTKASGNTGSVLQIEDADIADLNIGDIILIKQAGAYHVSPITAKSSGTGTATVTLLVPKASGNFANSVVIAKFTTYTVAESGHPTLSITKFTDDAIKEMAIGCRVNKVALQDFSTGKIPSMSFGFEGLTFDRTLTAPDYSPSYDSALPPIVLDGRAYMDGTEIVINNLSFSMENTAGFSTSIASANGKIASRVTERKITGSFDPYQETDDISNFTKFVANTEFSLFAYAKNDKTPGVAGEFQNIVAVYMPKCLITELGQADADGLVQENVTFQASRGSAGTTSEIFVCFI